MIRLLLMALFFYLVYTLFTFVLRSFSPKQVPPEKTTTGEEMVRDPNCGTYVPRGGAVRKGGDYFCSEKCRDEYHKK